MKLLSICSIFLLAGLATTIAAPVEDGNTLLKGYLTSFLNLIGFTARASPCDLPENTCYNGGNCVETPDGGSECVCQPGFDGAHCKLVDYCGDEDEPKTCSDNGICVNTDASTKGYICYCEPGFTGDDCETQDKCYPNPCKHDGICIINEGGTNTTCECRDGYYGETCDIEDPCRVEPCLNGGTCSLVIIDDVLTRECSCKPQWEPPSCETLRNCTPPCENNGICAADHNDRETCFCPPGYSGIVCEHSVCEPSPCYNGGTCKVLDGKFHCDCPNGFSGDKCETNVCVGQNCNHGYCEVTEDGDANCVCNNGWSGEDCTTPDDNPTSSKPTTSKPTTEVPTTAPNPTTTTNTNDPCDGFNCHHGDCVVNEDDEAECNCKQGWHGDDCNERDDPTTAVTTEGPTPTTSATPDPVPGPCNVITCKNHGAINCQHCTGECIMDDNGDEQCVCDDGWHGDQCADEDQQ